MVQSKHNEFVLSRGEFRLPGYFKAFFVLYTILAAGGLWYFFFRYDRADTFPLVLRIALVFVAVFLFFCFWLCAQSIERNRIVITSVRVYGAVGTSFSARPFAFLPNELLGIECRSPEWRKVLLIHYAGTDGEHTVRLHNLSNLDDVFDNLRLIIEKNNNENE